MDAKDQGFLILPHLLTNFQTQKYYQNGSRFNGVYSRDNLTDKIKDAVPVINLDEYSDIGNHWIALYSLNNNVTCFESFGVEHSKSKNLLVKRNIQINMFRIQAYNSVMCRYFRNRFIDFTVAFMVRL